MTIAARSASASAGKPCTRACHSSASRSMPAPCWHASVGGFEVDMRALSLWHEQVRLFALSQANLTRLSSKHAHPSCQAAPRHTYRRSTP